MKTLLILEDEPSVMKLLRRTLKQYRLVEATTAEEALLLFLDHIELDRRIDLLLADLTLPTMSGIQVAILLRSKIPDLPVILTSGYPVGGWSGRDSADLERLGADSVAILQKPFQAQALSNTICEFLGPSPSAAERAA
jgi:CheY-like chemotaxis protein